MAIRKIRTMGDRILNKSCRPVEEMTPKIQELIEDMLETMYDAYGVDGGTTGGNVKTNCCD